MTVDPVSEQLNALRKAQILDIAVLLTLVQWEQGQTDLAP